MMFEVFTDYVEFYFVVYKPAFGITCNFLFVSAFVHFWLLLFSSYQEQNPIRADLKKKKKVKLNLSINICFDCLARFIHKT